MRRNFFHNEKGNVLWIIMVGVFLFGALAFAVTQSGRSGRVHDREQALLALQEIVSYGTNIRTVVRTLRRVGGCGDGEISFYSPSFANPSYYDDNDNAACNVFDGGGAVWAKPPPLALDAGGAEYLFTGAFSVWGVGTSSAGAVSTDQDLLMMTHVNLDICVAINEKEGIDNPSGLPPAHDAGDIVIPGNDAQAFEGTYGTADDIGGDAARAGEVAGHWQGCYQSDDGKYVFYFVLMAR